MKSNPVVYILSLAIVFSGASCGGDAGPLATDLPMPNPIGRISLDANSVSVDDVELLVKDAFGHGFWAGTQGSAPAMPLSTIADEISSSWANWGMRDMSAEPRVAWNNDPTYIRAQLTLDPWTKHYAGIERANRALWFLDRGVVVGGDSTRTQRVRAFAEFTKGLSHGFLALMFDQGYVLDAPVQAVDRLPELVPASEMLAAALDQLDRSISVAEAHDFVIEKDHDWLFGLDVTSSELVQLANSYSARYMALFPRTPSERANVDWAAISERIDAGIVQDFAPIGDDNGDIREWDAMKFYGQEPNTWARADYRTIGPADESGAYSDWLATPVAERNIFSGFTSADRRIVGPRVDNGAGCESGGDTADCNGTYFQFVGISGPWPSARGTYHFSTHTHMRFADYRENNANGAMPVMVKAEMDLLKAEALLRRGGSIEEVAALINVTRVGNGELPATDSSIPVGTPDDAQSTSLGSSLWALLKHERRIETFATAGGLAYFDDRGLGDLVVGTPLHFPVPGIELELLYEPLYSFGGVGGVGAAGKRRSLRYTDRPK